MVYTVLMIKLLLIALSLTGCAVVEELTATTPVQSEVPAMPEFVTDVGKACARSCQVNYTTGNESCGLIVGGAAEQRAQCFNNSNILLGECYSTCE